MSSFGLVIRINQGSVISFHFFVLRTSTSDVIYQQIHSKCKLEKHNREQQRANCLLRSGLSIPVCQMRIASIIVFDVFLCCFFSFTKIPMKDFFFVNKKPKKRVSNERMKGNSDKHVSNDFATRCAPPPSTEFPSV